jgi:hypothetical protein
MSSQMLDGLAAVVREVAAVPAAQVPGPRFARLGAFALFWLWPGWHYRTAWLFAANGALVLSFAVLLLAPALWIIVLAQLLFHRAHHLRMRLEKQRPKRAPGRLGNTRLAFPRHSLLT